MANYYCTCRTNYFKVKDVFAFEEWASKYEVRVIEGSELSRGLVCDDPDGGPWPTWDPETDEEIDFFSELSQHLEDGEVAVSVEAGSEKSRYVVGHAVAINSSGEVLVVSLDDIYDKVKKEWGIETTHAEY